MTNAPSISLLSKNVALTRTTLIREVYRTLINTGRGYAAFTKKERELVEALKVQKEIFDPMSGYGLLTRYCAEVGLKSYCVEFNYPQYLWQLLCHPVHAEGFIRSVDFLLAWRARWPQSNVRAVISENWFPEESQELLLQLFALSRKAVTKGFGSEGNVEQYALAVLLPFSGRLSCSVPGDISTHTKKGGMCVYNGWEIDYELYLKAIRNRLLSINSNSVSKAHSLIYGDARVFRFPKNRFGAMITSPPYPNHRDFISMFSPEHALLAMLGVNGTSSKGIESTHVIGSNFVANREKRIPKAKAARRFLSAIKTVKRDKNAIYDDEVYYIPYFENYFADLEDAYQNVIPSLKERFEGYIVVVNNTHRNLVVPVSDSILEMWKSLGFGAAVHTANELFHIGTKNPRARGLRAKHMEYIIKIWR
jgi:hypothetical protein